MANLPFIHLTVSTLSSLVSIHPTQPWIITLFRPLWETLLHALSLISRLESQQKENRKRFDDVLIIYAINSTLAARYRHVTRISVEICRYVSNTLPSLSLSRRLLQGEVIANPHKRRMYTERCEPKVDRCVLRVAYNELY